MQIFNATPPADYPAQVIVQHDQGFCDRHPDEAYYLRVKGKDNAVQVHKLTGAIGAGHARQMACSMGFEPTHWTLPGDGHPFRYW